MLNPAGRPFCPCTLAVRGILTLAGFSFCLGLAAGCGDATGLAKRYPVQGTVTYNGKPVESGTITFHPADVEKGRTASGTIQDGSYRLTTAEPNDGALPGSYKVTIVSQAVDMAQVEANRGGGAGRQDDIVKAQAQAKKLIPAKYQLAETSGLTFEVKEGSNTANFELTD